MLVVDGNGESEVIALWLVVHEDKMTISHLMDIFLKHNDTTKTKCIMADKDMVERSVIAEKIPSAVLMICLFHTLRSFRREITSDKMGISAAQRITVLEIISKLVYARDEEEYMKFYRQLRESNLNQVIEYFEDNWHGIKEQWVEGLKCEVSHYLNSTNNRLESINQKIKSVVTKYSSLVIFFQELMKCLDSLALERDHRAAMVFKKCPVNLHPDKSCLFKYQELLTPYSFSFLVKQFELCSKVKITESVRVDKNSYTATIHVKERSFLTSDCQCSCGFYKAMELPCRHIFALRKYANLDPFEAELCATRWTRDYYRNSHRIFSTNASVSMNLSVSTMDKLPALKVLSQNEKYRKIFVLAQKLANVASHISTREFSYAVQCLEKVLKAWEQGQQVTIEVVDIKSCHDEEENDIVRNDRCDDTAVSHVETNDDNPPLSFTPKNHLNIDKCFNADELPTDLNTDELPTDLSTDELPTDLNTDELPTDLNTDKLPADLITDELPADLNTDELPADLNTDNLPTDLNTDELPTDLNADELPADLSADELPADLITDELPADLNTDELPADRNTDELPTDLNSNNHDAVHFPTDRDHSAVKGLSAGFNITDHCNISGSPVSNSCGVVNDLCDDINSDNHSSNLAPDLTSIKLPPKIKKRGRPKGAGLTIIGLPRKKKCTDGPVKFLMKTRLEREKQILRWMLPDGLIKKVVQDELLECDDLSSNLLEFSPNLLDENVNWASVQRFFTKAAWIQITDKMAELQRDPKWKFGACHDDLLLSPSVVCESCLVWYHLKCVGLTAAPKKTLWFCRPCYATDDTVEKKETTETKVDTVLAIACFYFIFCRVSSHQRINSRVISLKKLKLQSNLSNVTKVIVEESFYITMVSVSTMM